MKSKIIKIRIDEDNFPMLFKIDKEELGSLCFNIFEFGYNMFFPSKDDRNNTQINNLIQNNQEVLIKNMDYRTDSIKNDIQKIENKMCEIEIEDKLEKFSTILDQLFGISNNSSRKGKLTEDVIYTIMKNKFKDYTFQETRNIPHSGDAIINIPKNNKIVKVMIEIKNYNNTVDTEEINKLKYDMKQNKIKYSIFISMKSGFVGKKQLSFEEFTSNNELYTILYVPTLSDDINKFEVSIIMMDRIVDFQLNHNTNFKHIKWLENSIVNNLAELDDIFLEFNDLKNSYLKVERSVKQSLAEHYLSLVNYESNLKVKINRIWKSVNSDFESARKELLASNKMDSILESIKQEKNNKNLIKIIQQLMKYGFCIGKTDIGNLFYILSSANDIVGTILKDSKIIEVSFNNPKIKLRVDTKKKIDTEIITINGILSSLASC